MDYNKNYQYWIDSPKLDRKSRENLEKIRDNENEKKIRFGKSLSFGTAGLRGIMTEGSNAMNIYTLSQATQGFAQYIVNEGCSSRGIVIAYDCRNNSKLFAERAACVMAANGVQVYIFDSLRPTPLLSFSILKLSCAAGINITASHNSKEYNGYKAYWEDGAQLSPEQASAVSQFISEIDVFNGIKEMSFEEGINSGKIKIVGKELDDAYIEAVKAERINPIAIQEMADEMKIVYTPLYGAGAVLIPRILKECGLKNLYTVDSQMMPDGNFPNMKNPNPEYPEVFEEGIKIADKYGADLIIASDPDSDRMGVMVRASGGEFVTLNGNQTGALLLDYIVKGLREKNALPKDAYAIKTVVSTPLVDEICKRNNIKLHTVLTGFKFIGEVIKNHLESGKGSYLFGFEESYGYLRGTYARDKDAVNASMLITEAAAYYMKRGKTLYDAVNDIYDEYGFFLEKTESISLEGPDGAEKAAQVINTLREDPPKEIGGEKVVYIADYKKGQSVDFLSGKIEKTGLPESDVLYFKTERENIVIVRPSGTEPKFKIYFMLRGKNAEEAKKIKERFKDTALEFRESISSDNSK